METAIVNAFFDILLYFVIGCAILWIAVKLLSLMICDSEDALRMEQMPPQKPRINFRRWIGL